MPVTNVKTKWVDGNLVFYDASMNEIATWDGANRELSFPSGSTLAIESGASFNMADGTLELPDIAVAQGSILVGDSDGEASALSAKGDGKILVGNGTTITSVTVSGDATLANTGALTIAEGAVEDSMIVGLAAGQIIVGVDGTAANNTKVTLSGDVTMDATGAVTIAAKAVEDTMITAGAGTVLVGTKTDGDVTLLDNSAAGSIVIGQGAGETCAAAVLSGDVTMDATGAVTIAAGAVEASMLADGAGIAALVTAGGGASAAYAKTTSGAQTLLAANGSGEGARTVLIVVTVTETFAAGDGTATSFDVGETDTTTKFKSALTSGTAGDILTYAGALTEEKALLVTATAATGTGAGAIAITVLALPAS